ncbi:MAG: GC-type dockerin domain-anchored protein [Planctomycetota bacterium]
MRLIVLATATLLVSSTHAQVLRVDPDANNGGNGSSWARAFNSLHLALDAARTGTEIWVREGEYVPRIPNTRDATFSVPGGVQLYGGFQGGETSRSQRRPDNNPTKLTGAGFAYTVVTILGDNAVIDGFIIGEGLADGIGGARSRGAGIYAEDAAPIIRNTTFSGHQSNSDGAAITLNGASPVAARIENCMFEENTGVFTVSSEIQLVLSDSEISSNDASALQLEGTGTHFVTRALVRVNDAGLDTIRVDMSSLSAFTQFVDCTIASNNASQTGGIAYRGLGDHEVISCRIRGNEQSTPVGSAGINVVLEEADDSVTIENTAIIGNVSEASAGGIAKDSPAELNVINTTIVGNRVPGPSGAGANIASGITNFRNTIIYDNIFSGPGGNQRSSVLVAPGATVIAQNSCIQYLASGIGAFSILFADSIAANPGLVDPDGNDNTFGTADDNIRPAAGSPVIDRGNSLFVGPFVFADIYEQPRFRDDTGTADTGTADGSGNVVDIGAAEFQGTTPSDCLADTNGDGLVNPADFNAWVIAFNTQSPACDQNEDGLCNPADFNAWVINFNAGC